MTFSAELAGVHVIEARVTLPLFGIFHADVTVERELSYAPTDRLKLVIGDLTLACAPWRAAVGYAGKTRVRLIGGAGGWRTVLVEKSYRATAGVKLALVLGDAAREAGEKIVVAADRTLGNHFVREAASGSQILNAYLPDAWWVSPDGTTRTGPRDVADITSPFSLTSYDGSRGVAVVATERPGDFLPGKRFRARIPNTTITIGGVTHTVANTSLRTEVLAA